MIMISFMIVALVDMGIAMKIIVAVLKKVVLHLEQWMNLATRRVTRFPLLIMQQRETASD